MESVGPPLAYASGARRLLAAAIDYFVIILLTVPFVGGSSRQFSDSITEGTPLDASVVARITVVILLVIVGYSTAMHAWRGATFGKIAARTVLVNDDGTRVTPAAAFVRAVTLAAIFFIGSFLLSVPLLLNELRPFWNRRRQTFHDTVARTVVVRADSLNGRRTDPADD